VIYDSTEEVDRWRNRFAEGVGRLAEEGVQIDTSRTLIRPISSWPTTAGTIGTWSATWPDLPGLELCPAGLAGCVDGRSRLAFFRPIFATIPSVD